MKSGEAKQDSVGESQGRLQKDTHSPLGKSVQVILIVLSGVNRIIRSLTFGKLGKLVD